MTQQSTTQMMQQFPKTVEQICQEARKNGIQVGTRLSTYMDGSRTIAREEIVHYTVEDGTLSFDTLVIKVGGKSVIINGEVSERRYLVKEGYAIRMDAHKYGSKSSHNLIPQEVLA